MFKKKPQIKNLSPLRSSDRRKLADQIIHDYHIPIPQPLAEAPTDAPVEPTNPDTDPSAPTLATIRASLLPESSLSARFTTTTGPNASAVAGTVYVGVHPGQQERILWLHFEQDKRIYPTVYSLWQNPGLVPLLHTQDFVVEKLKGGADMMVPGLVGGPPWPDLAKKGSVVAIAGLGKDTVPLWIGTCEVDISALGEVRGTKGRAVRGLQWVGDEVWSWSSVPGIGGNIEPAAIKGWHGLSYPRDAGGVTSIGEGIDDLGLHDEEDDAEDDGGVAIGSEQQTGSNGHAAGPGEEDDDEEPETEPTTAEVDSAFLGAFLYAAHSAKKQNQTPNRGFDFPIQPSYLISKMIQPHLKSQSPHYAIKKTSWKNTKKFIKHLDKQGLVKSKDRNGGETVILDIDFDDMQIQNFTPYKLPKPKPSEATSATPSSSSSTSTDTSIGQTLNLITVLRPSPKLVPDLLPSKTHFYTTGQIQTYLKTYLTANVDLTASLTNPRNVKINPFIGNSILGTNTTATDTKHLAASEVPRDYLLKRVTEDTHLTTPYWTLSPSNSLKWDPEHPDPKMPKPKPYPLPTVQLTIEKRTGSKLVTRIVGLETFHITPALLAPELQRKCAGSASVGQAMGRKPGEMEVLVQGDQREIVTVELGKRGVRAAWVEVVDKTKKGKGGAGAGAGAGGGGGGRR